jgi:hypothetical protein
VYANRRRVQGNYGKGLLRRRGELVERSFAHCYDTGGMRRTHLRKHPNILKRQLIHVAGFNLSLIFRKLLGAGTPRAWNNRGRMLFLFLLACSPADRSKTGVAEAFSDREPLEAKQLPLRRDPSHAGHSLLAPRAARRRDFLPLAVM